MFQTNLLLEPKRGYRNPPQKDQLIIEAADLFCGAGGTSSGLIKAANSLNLGINLLAINHNPEAISTHSLNHPYVRHLCESLDNLDPRKLAKRLHILTASPECINHSNAKAGLPRNDQSRATAWHILRWVDAIYVDCVMIENVPEFKLWGPLDKNGHPIKKLQGTLFNNFIASLRALNYGVEYRVVNCADYGDPTARQRLIILCKKNGTPIWPDTTHADPTLGLQNKIDWHTAEEIIDWDLPGNSIFKRRTPLKPNTMDRILFGLKKFKNGEPFIVQYRGTDQTHIKGSAISVDRPLPTITAGGFHFGLIQPFIIHMTHQGSHRCHSLNKPIPTITGAHRGELALVQAQLKQLYQTIDPNDIEPTFENNRCFLRNKQSEIVAELDVFQRMLQPGELAKGMSFPDDYQFTGTKEAKIQMIGNAVPIHTAKAMTEALLNQLPQFQRN